MRRAQKASLQQCVTDHATLISSLFREHYDVLDI